MVAPVQNDLLNKIYEDDKFHSVFDPFHGSGISLYEASQLSTDIFLYGYDINPLANLITKSKLSGVDNQIENDIALIEDILKQNVIFPIVDFVNIDKWYRKDIQLLLSKLRYAIECVDSKINRLFFWTIYSNTVRKYSNSRSSTYKLHIKQVDKIANMKSNVFEDFLSQVKEYYKYFTKKAINWKLVKGDSKSLIKTNPNDSFDITITSPPYGDNNTTVPYGQFSSFALRWIPTKDLEFSGWETETYSSIDNNSLGGNKSSSKLSEYEKNLINPYLSKISLDKKDKVIRFMADYFEILNEICRVTKKYIVMTLGNRTVDGITINLTEITCEYLEAHGFQNTILIEREIKRKRIPKMTSKVKDVSVTSMNREYVIVHKKTNSSSKIIS